RVTWDLRLPATSLPRPPSPDGLEELFGPPPGGSYVVPGKYAVSMAKRVEGAVTPIAGPLEFTVKYVGPSPLPADDLKNLADFQRQVVKLQRDLQAANAVAGDLTGPLQQLHQPLHPT